MRAGPPASRLALGLALLVGALTLAPVAMLAFGSVSAGLDAFGSFTLAKYVSAYTDAALLKVPWNTLVFVLGSTLLATLLALVLAYLIIAPAMASFDVSLEESARVCGASRATTLGRIVAPLLVPGIVSAWILMATMFLRELTLSVVLSRPGSEVLAVQILAYADDGLWGRLSALGMVMIAISTALVVLAHRLGSRFKAGMAPAS
ncbi:MAG TPA: ABC transporter permease subunit [Rubrivivax sp.]|nr:ABC transporter permease subunit [Rubrivivax sp.]